MSPRIFGTAVLAMVSCAGIMAAARAPVAVPRQLPRRRRGPGGVWLFAVVAGLLAALGVQGASPSVAQASSSSALNWTKQAPAASPSAREAVSMAYDAATGNVVLFGGLGATRILGDTWVWDGTTWTKRAPRPARPPGKARRWPMTRPPATWSCSAA
jgi:Galactose oxidase, central domain